MLRTVVLAPAAINFRISPFAEVLDYPSGYELQGPVHFDHTGSKLLAAPDTGVFAHVGP